jgi:23S rRNA (pseudouridine1915-N3)-methyltransferase
MVIGGVSGLAPEIIKRADKRLSLSPMTFTHDMARLILVEQIYRAYTIKASEPYHH